MSVASVGALNRTERFVRDVTDSGAEPTGVISSKNVRATAREVRPSPVD
jgi:hypothetical protein